MMKRAGYAAPARSASSISLTFAQYGIPADAQLWQGRKQIIASSSDGFFIAEKDLQMRGPGEFFGTKQHGLPELTAADLAKHMPILNGLREDVKSLLQSDPRLEAPKNLLIRQGVERMFGDGSNIGI